MRVNLGLFFPNTTGRINKTVLRKFTPKYSLGTQDPWCQPPEYSMADLPLLDQLYLKPLYFGQHSNIAFSVSTLSLCFEGCTKYIEIKLTCKLFWSLGVEAERSVHYFWDYFSFLSGSHTFLTEGGILGL